MTEETKKTRGPRKKGKNTEKTNDNGPPDMVQLEVPEGATYGRYGYYVHMAIGRVAELLDSEGKQMLREDGNPDFQELVIDELSPVIVFEDPGPIMAFAISTMFQYYCSDDINTARKTLAEVKKFLDSCFIEENPTEPPLEAGDGT